jgi:hypothetical protein
LSGLARTDKAQGGSVSNDKINPYDLGDVGRRMRRADLPTQRHLPPRDELADLRTEVARLKAELVALKGRTCATCKEFGVVDGHGHCNRFLSPRDTWSFCECWEPRKDKEVPETCATCKHYDGAEHLSLCWTHDSYVDPADFCSHHENKEAADAH